MPALKELENLTNNIKCLSLDNNEFLSYIQKIEIIRPAAMREIADSSSCCSKELQNFISISSGLAAMHWHHTLLIQNPKEKFHIHLLRSLAFLEK